MSKLADKQAQFADHVTKFLVLHFPKFYEGSYYRFRFGWTYRTEVENRAAGGHPQSNHRNRLALDLIIDKSPDGIGGWIWVESGDDPIWGYLHEIWRDAYGGASAIPEDANHFSFEYNGVR